MKVSDACASEALNPQAKVRIERLVRSRMKPVAFGREGVGWLRRSLVAASSVMLLAYQGVSSAQATERLFVFSKAPDGRVLFNQAVLDQGFLLNWIEVQGNGRTDAAPSAMAIAGNRLFVFSKVLDGSIRFNQAVLDQGFLPQWIEVQGNGRTDVAPAALALSGLGQPTQPPQPRQPYDVIASERDPNGFWRNPNWAWEVAAGHTDGLNSPASSCGLLTQSPCTSMQPWVNVSDLCRCVCKLDGSSAPTGACTNSCQHGAGGFSVNIPCGVVDNSCLSAGGHVNWGVAALYGRLFYHDRTGSGCAIDCDYNVEMHIRAQDGIRVPVFTDYAAGGRHLEFKADETVERYDSQLPWWSEFASTDDNGRRQKMTDRDGIAIGVFSVDAAHYTLATELHPVFALGVHVDTPGSKDDMWAVFFHKQLSEGYCGRTVQALGRGTIEMVLPWRAGATSVLHNAVADKMETDTEGSSYSVDIDNNRRSIVVTMSVNDDPTGKEDNPFIAGEIHFQWDAAEQTPFSHTAAAPAAAGSSGPRDAEDAASDQIAKLPAAARLQLAQKLGEVDKHFKKVSKTFPAKLVASSAMPKESPSDARTVVRSISNPDGEEAAREAVVVIRNTLGKDTPQLFQSIPGPCAGDCNSDGSVTVNEILVGVNIALGGAPVSTCLPSDSNEDGNVAIDELLAAVNNALTGCGGR